MGCFVLWSVCMSGIMYGSHSYNEFMYGSGAALWDVVERGGGDLVFIPHNIWHVIKAINLLVLPFSPFSSSFCSYFYPFFFSFIPLFCTPLFLSSSSLPSFFPSPFYFLSFLSPIFPLSSTFPLLPLISITSIPDISSCTQRLMFLLSLEVFSTLQNYTSVLCPPSFV